MEKTKKRNGFASGIGFILAAAGSAVGLGNLWSFPAKTSVNGGAAFVFVYIACVLLIGAIAMISEIYIGKRSQANPVTSLKKVNKNMGWLGLAVIAVPFIIICYYSILGGYTVKFAVNSFASNVGIIKGFAGSTWQVVLFTAIFMALALIVVIAGVKGGIEKASKILMPALFILLVCIVVYCLCLGEGVSDGLNSYLNPDFSKLSFSAVLAAMGQAFFSLSLGMGAMICYGSYTGKEIKVGKSTAIICLFDTIVALLAGLAIFPAIGHFKAISSSSSVSEGGLFLMFETMPLVFDSLGFFGKIISFLFFAMVVIAALTSVMSLMEVVTQFVIQKFKIKRWKAITVVAIVCFAISIPTATSLGSVLNKGSFLVVFGQDLLDLFDIITNTVLMPVCALGACVAIGWSFSKNQKKTDIFNPMLLYRQLKEDGLDLGFFGKIFAVMVKYVTPLLILLVEIFGLVDLIMPNVENEVTGIVSRVFSSNGLGIVITSYVLLGICVAVYFIFFKNSETGCNADEIDIGTTTVVEEELSNVK